MKTFCLGWLIGILFAVFCSWLGGNRPPNDAERAAIVHKQEGQRVLIIGYGETNRERPFQCTGHYQSSREIMLGRQKMDEWEVITFKDREDAIAAVAAASKAAYDCSNNQIMKHVPADVPQGKN